MLTESWCVERLQISTVTYERLKRASLNTFGDIAVLEAPMRLADKANISLKIAQEVFKEINDLEDIERKTAASTNAETKSQPQKETAQPAEEAPKLPSTLEELEDYPKETITPEIAAGILGCDPQNIRSQAQIDAGALGFPVIVMGSRVKIPRRGFLYFMEYGRTNVQRKS